MVEQIIAAVSQGNAFLNGLVWGIPMLVLILGTGVYMSLRTRFFQVRKAKHIIGETFLAIFRKKSVTKTKDKKAISQFQALSTALAATIGTGNIAGVATAVSIGGPGAVFWMWVSAFFGMMTSYSENVLGIFFRKKNDKNEWAGGPMYYLENGLSRKKGCRHLGKILAVAFAIFCILASFGIGNMTQVNSIATSLETAFTPMFGFEIPPLVTGIVLAVIAGLVVIGGIKRIGKVTEKLVPIMAGLYILGALIIFFFNFQQIPYVFGSIFASAFSFEAIGGGIGGVVVRQAVEIGFKRGVFSNEAGLGSSVMVNSSSDVKEPAVQGMWGIFEVFFDTIIVCTLTAFILLSSTAGDAVPLDQALSNISTQTQYVQIANGDDYEGEIPLIDARYNEALRQTDKESGQPLRVQTVYGQELTIYTAGAADKTAEDYVFTNIMSVKGVPQTDPQGKVVTDENGNPVIASVKIEKVQGIPLVTYAFSQCFGDFVGIILAVAILLFAFSTVLGWSFYGTKAAEYLFGGKSTILYKILFVAFIVVGATMSLDLAWGIADTLNGLMALPNLIGVLALSGIVVKITANYIKRKSCKNPRMIEPMLSAYADIQHEQYKKLLEEDDLVAKPQGKGDKAGR